jgi:hypothetical protein
VLFHIRQQLFSLFKKGVKKIRYIHAPLHLNVAFM